MQLQHDHVSTIELRRRAYSVVRIGHHFQLYTGSDFPTIAQAKRVELRRRIIMLMCNGRRCPSAILSKQLNTSTYVNHCIFGLFFRNGKLHSARPQCGIQPARSKNQPVVIQQSVVDTTVSRAVHNWIRLIGALFHLVVHHMKRPCSCSNSILYIQWAVVVLGMSKPYITTNNVEYSMSSKHAM
jgi:hypothetical protein